MNASHSPLASIRRAFAGTLTRPRVDARDEYRAEERSVPLPTHVPKLIFALIMVAGLFAVALLVLRAAPSASAQSSGDLPGQGFLPNDRAWELVSPPDKAGHDISASSWRVRASAGGSAVMFASLGGFAGAKGVSAWGSEYMARRSSTGWNTHPITPAIQTPVIPQLFEAGYRPSWQGAFAPDLSKGVFFAPNGLDDEDPNVEKASNLYLGSDLLSGSNDLKLVSPCPGCASPLPEPSDYRGLAYAGASDDFRHIIFESHQNLTGETTGTTNPKLYEWLAESNQLRYVGVLPDSECGSPPCIAVDGAAAGNGAGGGVDSNVDRAHHGPVANSISDDGSRIFFTATPFSDVNIWPSGIGIGVEGHQIAGTLYYRDSGTTTAQVNISERTDCATQDPCAGSPDPDPAGSKPAMFQWALGDGSAVFFVTEEKMIDADENSTFDIYRADLDAPSGQRLSLISNGEDLGMGVSPGLRIIGVSDDGDFVYFLGSPSSGTPVPPGLSQNPGQALGIYVWHEGESRLVADEATRAGNIHVGEAGPSNSSTITGSNTFRFSPDGRYATFASTMPQGSVGYDTHVALGEECEYQLSAMTDFCAQIYVYDFASDQLSCASCNPTGAAPTNDAVSTANIQAGAFFKPPTDLNRSITDDGSLVFFSTEEALVPEDVNGRYDVYQYGVDSDEHHLLTSGQDDSDSWFMNATSDGRTVYFTTREQLVGIDTDHAADLYAARVDGGFATQNPVLETPCNGDGCQEEPVAPPAGDDPGSGSYTGPGNTGAESSCAAEDRRVAKLVDKARALKRKAREAPGKRAKRLKKKAKKATRKAKKAKQSAAQCRRKS